MVAPPLALVIMLAGVRFSSAAGDFLRQSVPREVIERMLLAEIPTSGRNGHRLPVLQETLAPMFAALPKNGYGRLDPPTVRYALHRYFVQQYGWYVKGLDPLGDGWNSSSPEGVMKNRVPAYIQGIFEGRLQGRGMDVAELAIFTATLADLIERDAALGLEQIYYVLGLPADGVSEEQLDAAVRAFIAKFILGSTYPVNSVGDIAANERELHELYPDWNLTTMWAVDIRHTLDLRAQSQHNPFVSQEGIPFDRATTTLQGIMHNVAALAKYECPSLKAKMLELEVADTGRVRLSDFYAKALVPIMESPEYLRNLGVLDDTDPSMPMVVIPNYMVSQSNCLAESSYYQSCCLDECEGLLGHVERALAAPLATPEQIFEVVAMLPSDTVASPRNLSSSLLARLSEVADYHDGLVPLHGRLFMQWMHHAYPRECPWPLVSGTSKPLSQDEWMEHADRDDIHATKEEIERCTSARHWSNIVDVGSETIPWVVVEELVAEHQPLLTSEAVSPSSVLHAAMASVALVSVAYSLAKASGILVGGDKDKVHAV